MDKGILSILLVAQGCFSLAKVSVVLRISEHFPVISLKMCLLRQG